MFCSSFLPSLTGSGLSVISSLAVFCVSFFSSVLLFNPIPTIFSKHSLQYILPAISKLHSSHTDFPQMAQVLTPSLFG